jgi:hypothetical protein
MDGKAAPGKTAGKEETETQRALQVEQAAKSRAEPLVAISPVCPAQIAAHIAHHGAHADDKDKPGNPPVQVKKKTYHEKSFVARSLIIQHGCSHV